MQHTPHSTLPLPDKTISDDLLDTLSKPQTRWDHEHLSDSAKHILTTILPKLCDELMVYRAQERRQREAAAENFRNDLKTARNIVSEPEKYSDEELGVAIVCLRTYGTITDQARRLAIKELRENPCPNLRLIPSRGQI